MKQSPIIVALDYADADAALAMADQLDPAACRVKVGKELFTVAGPEVVKQLVQRGFDVFLDLKFHDIPNTVAGAVRAAASLGVWMVNVHAGGGVEMMAAAKQALAEVENPPLLIAVTVLTSFSQEKFDQLGYRRSLNEQVAYLASEAQQAGLDGVVCSAAEAQMLRSQLSSDFALVTPGIRPKWAAKNDQQRIVEPLQAINSGVNYMVIGRPITHHELPQQAVSLILQELSGES